MIKVGIKSSFANTSIIQTTKFYIKTFMECQTNMSFNKMDLLYKVTKPDYPLNVTKQQQYKC